MIKKIIIAVLGLSLIGCMGPSLEERRKQFGEVMDYWIGADINRYIHSMGYPSDTRDLPNGNKLYIFQQASTRRTPVYISPTTTTITPLYGGGATATTTGGHIYGGNMVTDSCTKYIETDPSGKIVYWRAEGNNCY
ncbi:hypothetical protein [Geothrix sp. 21YS21S-4]|uniref:hypothetical protein n=1 Tax=Geothrix sp. 21YS21S-4 TaxID=3068889 RepID=UPI0027BB170A|nr:hypothetical protein [Geothrix sp. 21YS21S-4]